MGVNKIATSLLVFLALFFAIFIGSTNRYSSYFVTVQKGEENFDGFLLQKILQQNRSDKLPMSSDTEIQSSRALLNSQQTYTNHYYWDELDKAFKIESSDLAKVLKNFQNSYKYERSDLNNNSINEIYLLEKGILKISENNILVWQSPREWWIDDFVLADSNNDGIVKINLSLWKAGNFGTSKPFWIEKNDMSIKNHFFVLSLINNEIKQIWCSSNLSQPNCEFKFSDIDKDGKNELIVIEGNYYSKPFCRGNYFAVWKWNGWGFSNEWRSVVGRYEGLEIEEANSKKYIIVHSIQYSY